MTGRETPCIFCSARGEERGTFCNRPCPEADRKRFVRQMTPDQAADLAAATLAAIDARALLVDTLHLDADRERVASDLGLLTNAWDWHSDASPLSTFAHEAAEAGLRRTAALYGVGCECVRCMTGGMNHA